MIFCKKAEHHYERRHLNCQFTPLQAGMAPFRWKFLSQRTSLIIDDFLAGNPATEGRSNQLAGTTVKLSVLIENPSDGRDLLEKQAILSYPHRLDVWKWSSRVEGRSLLKLKKNIRKQPFLALQHLLAMLRIISFPSWLRQLCNNPSWLAYLISAVSSWGGLQLHQPNAGLVCRSFSICLPVIARPVWLGRSHGSGAMCPYHQVFA